MIQDMKLAEGRIKLPGVRASWDVTLCHSLNIAQKSLKLARAAMTCGPSTGSNTFLNSRLTPVIGEELSLKSMLIEGLRRHVGIVLAIGMSVEALFLLFGFSYYNLFSPLFDSPADLYSCAIVILGTCLTGIIVGFLVSDKKHAAAYGFLSAFIPSLFFSFLVSQSIVAGPPLVLLIPFFILLFFDSLAAVGGAWGSSIKTKTFFAATVTILLLTSLIFSGGLFVMPTRQSDNLIVGANEIYNITSRNYVQEGNITVKDNATLLIQNCKFTSNQMNQRCIIEIEDQGHLEIENSELYVLTRMYGGHRSSTIYVRDNASAIIKDSEIVSHGVVALQNAHVESMNSKWDYGAINTQDNSEAIIINSSVESAIHLGQNSSIYFSNSTNPYYTCSGTAHLSIESSNNKANYVVTHGYMTCSGNCSISLINSTIDGVSADAFKGVIISNSSSIDESVSIQNGANFYLFSNLTITGKVEEFSGDVTREYTILTAPNLQLNVTWQNTNVLVWEGESDQNGLAAFEITFTAKNYTQQVNLNGQMLFNLTSTTPLTLPLP
jgi:hypothetical protein